MQPFWVGVYLMQKLHTCHFNTMDLDLVFCFFDL